MSDISEREAQKTARRLLESKFGREESSLKLAESGDSNYTFIIDQDFVVKIERRDEWHENMLREPLILKLIENKEITTPELIDSGAFEGLHYRIMNFIEGETLDKFSDGRKFSNISTEEKKKIARLLGKSLAQIHSSKRFEGFGNIERDDKSIKTSADNWYNGLLDLEEWWLNKLREEDFNSEADQIKAVIESDSENLADITESRLLHMEFGLRNTIIQKNNVAVLDWELAAAGDPLLDFIMSQKRLFWITNRDKELEKIFREGYEEIRTLKQSEKLEDIYELVQMSRFLVIFRNNEDKRTRILDRINQLVNNLS